MALDWDKLRVFHAVAVAGSFTRATDILNISQSAISRQVSILEEELGTSLFQRLPRGLNLTEAGEKLNEVVNTVFGKLAMVETAISEEKNLPKGELTLTASTSLGTLLIAPRLKGFLETYPDMRINLQLLNGDISLPQKESDITIIDPAAEHPDYIFSEPVTLKTRLYASQNYIDQHGLPQDLSDLNDHRLIVSSQGVGGDLSKNWLLNLGTRSPRTPYAIVESSLGIAEAVKSGLGIGCSFRYIVGENSHLVEILPDQASLPQARVIAYSKPLADLKKVQIFAEFLLDTLKTAESSEAS